MTIASTDYLFGPPSSLTVGGAEIGPSEDPATVTITETTWGPDLQGTVSQIAGLMRVTKIKAELKTKLNNLSLAMLQVALHNITPTVGTAATTANGHSQILAADAAAAQNVVKFPGVALANPSAAVDDIIDTQTAHGFVAGQRVMFESITGGTGLAALTPYYVIAANLAATTLQVSATSGGAAINFTTDITAGVLIPAYTAAQFLKIGDVGETELVAISAVGTSGSGGTGLTFTTPLVRAHDSGDAILQVVDAGTTILRQRIGYIPTSDHKDVIMQAIGPDGLPYLVTLFDCLNTEGVTTAFGDATSAGTPVTFTAFADITDPTLAPYAIERLTV